MAYYPRPALVAVTTAAQSPTEATNLVFAINYIGPACSVAHAPNSAVITASLPGLYSVTFNGDVVPATAGTFTVALYNNGVAVPGAQATFTGEAATSVHVAFDTIIKVLKSCACIDNTANLTVQVSAGATVTNAAFTIIKEA